MQISRIALFAVAITSGIGAGFAGGLLALKTVTAGVGIESSSPQAASRDSEVHDKAYAQACRALLRRNSRMPAEKIGEYAPNRVVERGPGRFAVTVPYDGWDIYGKPTVKFADCNVLLEAGVWRVEHVPDLPEYRDIH